MTENEKIIEETVVDNNGTWGVKPNGTKILSRDKTSQEFDDREAGEITQETKRRTDSKKYQFIQARSKRRIDIVSVTEIFDGDFFNEVERDKALEVIEAEWQIAVDKFQASE